MKVAQVYDNYVNGIFKYFYVRTSSRELSEDLTSKTFEKVLKNFEKYDKEKGAISTWVYTIASNTLIDYYRVNSKKKHVELTENNEPQTNVGNKSMETDVELDIGKKVLTQILSELHPEDQELMHLRYTLEYSYKEVSKKMGIDVNAVGVRMHRITKRIKQDRRMKNLTTKV